MAQRRRTSTSNFGVGRREAHDARAFYARFEAPEVSSDAEVTPPTPVADPFIVGDARCMDAVADGSVALVVTSPPYFAGKQYEEELDREGVPGSYLEYLALLRDVFSECKRKLEPGGRLAVNVANLGRKPYRSLSSDVMTILQDDLRLLARGEVIWQKGDGASGSCAWGSFRSASNPVLRDITERVVIVSKGRFDRAKNVKERASLSLPHENTLTSDEFMAATLDVWNIPPESARRVDHPAPFPVELPLRLIELYTYRDDLVLDPFMGSGSTLVAAARSGRRFVGFDLDPAYVEIARRRVASDGGGGTAVPAPPGAGAPGPPGSATGSLTPLSRRGIRAPGAGRGQGGPRPGRGPAGHLRVHGDRPQRPAPRAGGDAWTWWPPTPPGPSGTSTCRVPTRRPGAAWRAPTTSFAPWAGPTCWRPRPPVRSSCSAPTCPAGRATATLPCGRRGPRGSSTSSRCSTTPTASSGSAATGRAARTTGRGRGSGPKGRSPEATMSRLIACAVVRDDPPVVIAADDLESLNWVLALKLIATTPAGRLPTDLRDELRRALVEERWGDAVGTWIERTGVAVDVYPSMELYGAGDVELASLELQFQPLFGG